MTKHNNPMELFTGRKRGIFLTDEFVMDLIRALDDYPDLAEEQETLRLAASSSMADEIEKLLANHSSVAHETKADALRIALGRVAAD